MMNDAQPVNFNSMSLFAYPNHDEASSGFDFASKRVIQENIIESKDMFSKNIWSMDQNIDHHPSLRIQHQK